jgi:hypothetical protein
MRGGGRFREAFGMRARPRIAFVSRSWLFLLDLRESLRMRESDAKTHRSPKALRAKSIRVKLVYYIELFSIRVRREIRELSREFPP